jgi:superfamily I DNA and/or RNA helicase
MNSEILQDLSIKISKYFLEFLESDFKRQQAPKRRIVLQQDNGFKCGMRLAPYAELQKVMWSLLDKPVSEELVLLFKPKTYLRQLSISLKLVLKEQVETITQESVDAIKNELVNQAKVSLGEALTDSEKWIESLKMVLLSEISTQVVRPMLSLIDEALSKQAYSQVDSIFNVEVDLIERLAKPMEDILTEVLARYSAKKDITELQEICEERLNLDFIKKTLLEYFEMYASSDAFLEFRDIDTYATTAEGIQLYLYIGTIKYGSGTYPLFYIPIESESDEVTKGYKLTLSSHIYANKRAIEFILQELGERQSRQWLSPIHERITYVESDKSIKSALEPSIDRIQKAFGLFEDFDLNDGPIKQLSDTNVSITNALHICAFEKSDEALLNDYEEMITLAKSNNTEVFKLFEQIVGDVLTNNPVSIESSIEAQWNSLSVDQRVMSDSPIPLNEEQTKIINAITHKEGKFIVVEGPPGTGKSHTIVAIAADCAFRNKSCLVLSDKKEALEVVQKKLAKTMNEVRGDSDFPNPLLRLGTEQANFRKLTSQQVLTQVQAHSKATNASQGRLKEERNSKRELLKQSIKQTVSSYENLKTQDIANAQKLVFKINEFAKFDIASKLETIFRDNSSFTINTEVKENENFKKQLKEIFEEKKIKSIVEMVNECKARAFASKYHERFNRNIADICSSIKKENIEKISDLLFEFKSIKLPIIGYLFQGSKVANISNRLQKNANFLIQIDLKRNHKEIEILLTQSRSLISWIEESNDEVDNFERFFSQLVKKDSQSPHFENLLNLFKSFQVEDLEINNFLNNNFNSDISSDLCINLLNYGYKYQIIKKQFDAAPSFDYVGNKTEIEKLNTTLMNSEVDSRLIDFMQNSKADAKIIAKLIKDKQKFPENKFDSVKEAFPIIVASIREFGEFMPLKSDIFDVLVIDEASQVSVAQAFPALLRAKKVVVMGDSKQFSNTKSSNASNSLNEKYRSDLHSYFAREVSNEAAMLERLSYFDVKKSILEFSQMCSNYSIMLRKHFRSYQELISYSSKTFYGGQLQAIKIRGVSINEVIKFTNLNEIHEVVVSTRSTNQSEADFILSKCIEYLEDEKSPTIGIITPYTEQQTLISKMVSSHARYQDLKSKLQIKVMTFDSCQGEERNIIFYSMVATNDSDTLNYIFPPNLDNAEELIEDKLKIQRLNVGFSRAQEMIWFVISKPIDDFKGSIAQALRHYSLQLNNQKATAEDTDPLSPMESKVLDWLYKTEFYQFYEEELEILPQFPIGDYLKQLDPTYKHPSYKVDFLITYTSGTGIVHIVIEYDGFEYHFKQDSEIDAGNHERYLNDSDIERQYTLESYGYNFIRINRFNLGKDPIKTLSDRLYRLINQQLDSKPNELVATLQNQASSLLNKSAKQCPICKQIKQHDQYFDQSLKDGQGGYGRNCIVCKKNSQQTLKAKSAYRRRW